MTEGNVFPKHKKEAEHPGVVPQHSGGQEDDQETKALYDEFEDMLGYIMRACLNSMPHAQNEGNNIFFYHLYLIGSAAMDSLFK